MKIEMIIHYGSENTEEQLHNTLQSIKDKDNTPDKIRLCINPPIARVPTYSEVVKKISNVFDTTIECYLQILTYPRKRIQDVINDTVNLSNADYYVFVNAGHLFEDNEIVNEIRNRAVIVSEGIDDNFNEFACNVKLHKHLGGFGEHYSLIEKIEYKLKALEEAKNNEKFANSDQDT